MPVELDPQAGLAFLGEAIEAFRTALAEGDPDAPVPPCPGWRLRELAWHLGGIHRWVLGAVVEGHPDTALVDGPGEAAELLAWFDDGASRLTDVLAGTDPDAPCWTFGAAPHTARFWVRRQAHENAVHAWDAQVTVGKPPTPIDPRLAADGIDEVATVFFPRQVRLHRIEPLTRRLRLRIAGAPGGLPGGEPGGTSGGTSGGEWLLAGDGTGDAVGAGYAAGAAADATVSGPAEALYLLLWGRAILEDPRLAVDGDVAAARAVLGTALVP